MLEVNMWHPGMVGYDGWLDECGVVQHRTASLIGRGCGGENNERISTVSELLIGCQALLCGWKSLVTTTKATGRNMDVDDESLGRHQN